MSETHIDKAMSDLRCAQSLPDRQPLLLRKVRTAWKQIKWQTYLLYCRTLYRPHMRLIHRWGWHWYTHLPFIDGGTERLWCQWCGDRWVRTRRDG